MKARRIFNENGNSFNSLITRAIETELVKLSNQKYNSGKDIAAIEEEEK